VREDNSWTDVHLVQLSWERRKEREKQLFFFPFVPSTAQLKENIKRNSLVPLLPD